MKCSKLLKDSITHIMIWEKNVITLILKIYTLVVKPPNAFVEPDNPNSVFP
jgi:hypothetical protein